MEHFGEQVDVLYLKEKEVIKYKHTLNVGVFINNIINMLIFLTLFYNLYFGACIIMRILL